MTTFLPLGAQVERDGDATIVRLTLRVEDVRVEKQTIVAERVAVRKSVVRGAEPVREVVRREELVVNTGGDVEHTQRLDIAQPPGTPPPRAAPTRRRPRSTVPWAERLD